MVENINWHKLATERKNIRNSLKAVGVKPQGNGSLEDATETTQSLDSFLDSIEAGEFEESFQERGQYVELQQRLQELNQRIAKFKKTPESIAQVRAEKYEDFFGEAVAMKRKLARLDNAYDILKKQEFQINSRRRGKISTIDLKILAGINEKIEMIDQRKNDLKDGIVKRSQDGDGKEVIEFDEKISDAYRAAYLMKTKQQMDNYGFATVGDVLKQKDFILQQILNQNSTLLEGPTGTGKTELLRNVIRETFNQEPEVLRCTERTGPSEIFGKTLLRAASGTDEESVAKLNTTITEKLSEFTAQKTKQWESENPKPNDDANKEEWANFERLARDFTNRLYQDEMLENNRLISLYAQGAGATETYFQPGIVPRCLEKNIPPILDEFNNMPLNMRFSLKELYNRKEGDVIIIQEDSERPMRVPANFTFLVSANLKGDKHTDRFNFDDAEVRVFDSEHIGYLKKEDQYDIALVGLMQQDWQIYNTKEEAEKVLKMLVKSAVDTQTGYTDKLELKDAKGKQGQLESAVFDPGQLFRMVKSYNMVASRKDLLTHLNEQIMRFVNKGGYEKDRGALVQIFQQNGFLQGKTRADFMNSVDEHYLVFSNTKNIFAERTNDGKDVVLTLEEIVKLDPYELRKKALINLGEEFLVEGDSNNQENSEGEVSIERAREVMGEADFIGAEDVEKTWGYIPENIPAIPFSEQRLEKARELGQFLILRVKNDKDGNPLTMKRINELKDKFSNDDKLLFSIAGYRNEPFFTDDTSELEWALVGKNIIGEGVEGDEYKTTSSTYLEQTEMIKQYLQNKMFDDSTMPIELREAISEYKDYLDEHPEFFTDNSQRNLKSSDELQSILNDDDKWEEYAKDLSKLKLNKLTRHTPVEVIQDVVAYYEKNQSKLLEGKYTFTSLLGSGSWLVRLGGAASDGVGVFCNWPGYRYSNVGVALSCNL